MIPVVGAIDLSPPQTQERPSQSACSDLESPRAYLRISAAEARQIGQNYMAALEDRIKKAAPADYKEYVATQTMETLKEYLLTCARYRIDISDKDLKDIVQLDKYTISQRTRDIYSINNQRWPLHRLKLALASSARAKLKDHEELFEGENRIYFRMTPPTIRYAASH